MARRLSHLAIALTGIALAVLSVFGARGSQSAPATVLTVDAAHPGHAIPPTLYGIFFEEINHAGDGGLYSELVRNRSFEDAPEPAGWSLLADGGGSGTLSLDDSQPLNEATPHALKLEVTHPERGRVGVVNGGYWGIPVSRGAKYRLSFWARRADGSGGVLSASLESAGGKRYATAGFARLASAWTRYSATLTSDGSDPAARLVLSTSAPGAVWIDVVSLQPDATWKRRPNGARADLAEKLSAMKPAFVRFPGGCFCEGDRLQNAFRWKKSLGDLSERPGHWNLWGYRSSDGLGYHEYLQLCEDLGAEPLFVINVGMSHTDIVPLDQLDPWVQDALDAVEYANGPATSKWGALRARHGHPSPFGLKYLEIGNENGWGRTLPRYEERYARFYDALKKRYPEVKLVANVPVRNRPMDLVDDHYYNNPEWFLNNAGHYDGYDRKRPKVYVGEYAVTQGCGQGNLRAALAEAAFMTGLERNSDAVEMASYAPLFVNVRDRKWNPDAIVYDGVHSYGTPSYYVQQLFSRYRPDQLLPSRVTGASRAPIAASGGIGLGTWLTQAEFRNVEVLQNGRPVYSAAFADGATGWRALSGEWKAGQGVYRQTSEAENVRTMTGDRSWTDYTLHLQARKLAGAEGFLVMFRVRDDANWYWWNVGGWGNTRHAIEKSTGGAKSIVGPEVDGSVETGRWYDLRIELQGPRIRCYLDGKVVHDVEDNGPAALYAVAGRRAGELILKVVNPTGEAQETQVRLEGAGRVAPRGEAVVLSGSGPDEENSLSQPERISPVTLPLAGLGHEFRHSFPPYSLTVLPLRSD